MNRTALKESTAKSVDRTAALLAKSLYHSMINPQYRVFICHKKRDANDAENCCSACGAAQIYQKFQRELKEHKLAERVELKKSGCLDYCTHGPVAMVFQPTYRTEFFNWPFLPKKIRHKLQAKIQKKIAPNRVYYGNLTIDDIPTIVQSHLIDHQVQHPKVIAQSHAKS